MSISGWMWNVLFISNSWSGSGYGWIHPYQFAFVVTRLTFSHLATYQSLGKSVSCLQLLVPKFWFHLDSWTRNLVDHSFILLSIFPNCFSYFDCEGLDAARADCCWKWWMKSWMMNFYIIRCYYLELSMIKDILGAMTIFWLGVGIYFSTLNYSRQPISRGCMMCEITMILWCCHGEEVVIHLLPFWYMDFDENLELASTMNIRKHTRTLRYMQLKIWKGILTGYECGNSIFVWGPFWCGYY